MSNFTVEAQTKTLHSVVQLVGLHFFIDLRLLDFTTRTGRWFHFICAQETKKKKQIFNKISI